MDGEHETAIVAVAEYGKISSTEKRREVHDPSPADIKTLLNILSRNPASFLNIERKAGPGVHLSVMRTHLHHNNKQVWDLERSDGSDDRYRIGCLQRGLAVELVTSWVTATTVPVGRKFGGYEWELLPPLPGHEGDGFAFAGFVEPPSQIIDAKPFSVPEFVDVPKLTQLVKEALTLAWASVTAEHFAGDLAGFGLDSVGDPFLLPTAFPRPTSVWVPAESSLHLVGEEHFNKVNAEIERSLNAYRRWEDTPSSYDGMPEDFDEMELYSQLCQSIYGAGVEALCKLRTEGMFSDNPGVVLNVWHMETQPTLEATIRRCNPPDIADTYLSQSS